LSEKLKGTPEELADTLKTAGRGGPDHPQRGAPHPQPAPDGDPNDPANPANQLTANLNNQGTIAAMSGTDAASTPPPQA
jgi:hypothetical protein